MKPSHSLPTTHVPDATALLSIRKIFFWQLVLRSVTLIAIYCTGQALGNFIWADVTLWASLWTLAFAATVPVPFVWLHLDDLKRRAVHIYGKELVHPPRDRYIIGRSLRFWLWASLVGILGFETVAYPTGSITGLTLLMFLAAVAVTVAVEIEKRRTLSYKQERALYRAAVTKEVLGSALSAAPATGLHQTKTSAPPETTQASQASIALTYENLEPALVRVLEKAQVQEERRRLRQEIIFLAVGVILAFLINWSSDSTLQIIRGLFRSIL
jgi:hypothetical protein